jgi:predicted ATPase
MKFKKHTQFMIDFISDFANGELDRYFFDLDYSAYVIEHFPHMEIESPRLADKFADTIDRAYERGTHLDLPDEAFRNEIANALDEWLRANNPDLI